MINIACTISILFWMFVYQFLTVAVQWLARCDNGIDIILARAELVPVCICPLAEPVPVCIYPFNG